MRLDYTMHIMCAFLYTLLFKKGIKLVSLAVWTAQCSAVIRLIIYIVQQLCVVMHCTMCCIALL